jgi:hypothetical protein
MRNKIKCFLPLLVFMLGYKHNYGELLQTEISILSILFSVISLLI